MKKLKELSINPEKIMNNDELGNLKGGYIPLGPFQVKCWLGGDYWGCGGDYEVCFNEGLSCCPHGMFTIQPI